MLPSPFGFGISADDEFLLQVELDFDPCSGALSGLISGAAAFANQTFKSHSRPGYNWTAAAGERPSQSA